MSTSPSPCCCRRAGSPSSCTRKPRSGETCWCSFWPSGSTRRWASTHASVPTSPRNGCGRRSTRGTPWPTRASQPNGRPRPGCGRWPTSRAACRRSWRSCAGSASGPSRRGSRPRPSAPTSPCSPRCTPPGTCQVWPGGSTPPASRSPGARRGATRPSRPRPRPSGLVTRSRPRPASSGCAAADREHAAVALAEGLRVGADCPVCLRPVTARPRHHVPADLLEARAAAEWAASEAMQARAAHDHAASAAAAAGGVAEDTKAQLHKLSATLAEAPGESELAALIDAVAKADETLGQARQAARTARQALAAAEQDRAALSEEERRAWADLSAARDSVVRLGAPATRGTDLAAAWAALTGCAADQHQERSSRRPDLDAAAAALQREVADARSALAAQLAEHGVTGLADPVRCEPAIATQSERAANRLAAVRASRRQAAVLDQQIRAHREDEQVATMLGLLLRASSFERWLCGEALDSLVAEASQTLMELSGGQYQLDRDERNDLVVVDYQDAGARRPVHTLSGGETFQASLALALALSQQVAGLSAGMRDLNSMFLDEGFGTLDEDTLETVASTLERLAADSDRMVGIVTHVAALAERVPVRFVVSRTGATSTLREERA